MPSTTAVFRAIADFASLNREIRRTKKELAELKAMASDTTPWDRFAAATARAGTAADQVSDAQRDLASSTKASSRASRGSAAAQSGLGTAMGRAAASTNRARDAQGRFATTARRAGSEATSAAGSVSRSAAAFDRSAFAADRARDASGRFASSQSRVRAESGASARATSVFGRAMEALGASGSGVGGVLRSVGSAMGNFGNNAGRASLSARRFLVVLLAFAVPTVLGFLQMLVQTVSALGAGMVGLAAAVAPAAAALAALGPAALTAAQSVGTVMFAFRGVGDALEAMTQAEEQSATTARASARQRVAAAQRIADAQRSLADAQRARTQTAEQGSRRIADAERALARARRETAFVSVDAARAVADAQDTLIDAQRRLRSSYDDLHAARQQAKRDLVDLTDRVSDNALTIEGAEIGLIRARRRLTELTENGTASELEMREARYRVAVAADRLSDAQRQARRDQVDLNEAERRGVEGSRDVVRARESVSEAQEALSDARYRAKRAAIEAARAEADAARRVADAERNLSRTRQAVARANAAATRRVTDAQRQLRRALRATAAAAGEVSAAQSKLSRAMANLSPAARRLVRYLFSLRDVGRSLSHTAQEALFPGLIRALRILVPMVDTLRGVIRVTGRTLGWLAVQTAKVVRSWEADLAVAGRRNAGILRDVGLGALGVADGFRHITMAALTLAEWFGRLIRRFGEWFAATMAAKRASGELAATFADARRVLAQLGRILYNLGGIFAGVFRAARPLGDWMLDRFERLTAAGHRWVDSVVGQRTMLRYFREMKPALSAIGALVADIAAALANAGRAPGFARLVNQIRTEFLPALGRMFAALSSSGFMSAVISLFSTLADVIAKLAAGGVGGLVVFARVLNLFAKALLAVLSIPGVGTLVGLLLAIAGAMSALSLIGTAIAAPFLLLLRVGGGAVLAMGGWSGVIRGVGIAFRFLGRALLWVGRALLANPFIAAVAAIALAAFLIIRYWRPIVGFFKAAFAAIASAAQWLWRTVLKPVFDAIAVGARWLFAIVAAVLLIPLRLAFLALRPVVLFLWRRVFRPAFQGIAAVGRWLWNNALKPVFRAMQWFWRNVTRPALMILRALFQTMFRAIAAVGRWLWNNALEPIFTAMKLYWERVLAPVIRWLYYNVIRPIFRGIGWFIGATWRNVIRPAFNALKRGVDLVARGFRGAVDWIGRQWNRLKAITAKPINFVLNWVYNKGIRWVWNRIAGAVGLPGLPEANLIRFASGGKFAGDDSQRRYAGGGRKRGGGADMGVYNAPTAIVGEGSTTDPEYVIPTDPRHRPRALALYEQLGTRLMQGGGVLGGAWNWIADKAGDAWDWARNGLHDLFRTLVSPFLGRLSAVSVSDFGRMVARAPRAWVEAMTEKIRVTAPQGSYGAGLAFARSKDDMSYQWAGVGNPSYDCSGYISAITNVIAGRAPNRRLFSTASFAGGGGVAGFVRGANSPFQIGVTPGSHMAGTLLGTNVESSGSYGVQAGPPARGARHPMFTYRFGYRGGGSRAQAPAGEEGVNADRGGIVRNTTRWPERVLSPAQTQAFERLVDTLTRVSDPESLVGSVPVRGLDAASLFGFRMPDLGRVRVDVGATREALRGSVSHRTEVDGSRTLNFTVNNPRAERSSREVSRRLRTMADLGLW